MANFYRGKPKVSPSDSCYVATSNPCELCMNINFLSNHYTFSADLTNYHNDAVRTHCTDRPLQHCNFLDCLQREQDSLYYNTRGRCLMLQHQQSQCVNAHSHRTWTVISEAIVML